MEPSGNFKSNKLPVINTVLYDLKFPDGSIKPYSANLIAENILMQADGDGIHHQLLEGILDHSKDKREIEKKDKYFISKCDRQSMRKITVGCKILVFLFNFSLVLGVIHGAIREFQIK